MAADAKTMTTYDGILNPVSAQDIRDINDTLLMLARTINDVPNENGYERSLRVIGGMYKDFNDLTKSTHGYLYYSFVKVDGVETPVVAYYLGGDDISTGDERVWIDPAFSFVERNFVDSVTRIVGTFARVLVTPDDTAPTQNSTFICRWSELDNFRSGYIAPYSINTLQLHDGAVNDAKIADETKKNLNPFVPFWVETGWTYNGISWTSPGGWQSVNYGNYLSYNNVYSKLYVGISHQTQAEVGFVLKTTAFLNPDIPTDAESNVYITGCNVSYTRESDTQCPRFDIEVINGRPGYCRIIAPYPPNGGDILTVRLTGYIPKP